MGSVEPIDERLVLTPEEMLNINDNTQPDIYFAVNKADGQFYLYNKSNDVDPTTGKFRLMKSEGGALVFTKDEWEALDPKPPAGTQVIISDDTSGGGSSENIAETVSFFTIDEFKDFVSKHHESKVYLFKTPVGAGYLSGFLTQGKTNASTAGVMSIKGNDADGWFADVHIYDGYLKAFTSRYSENDDEITGCNEFATMDKVNYKKINSLISFTENINNTNTSIYANGNALAINYQGEAKTHASGDILFTLPENYRPLVPTYCSFVINGDAFGTVEIGTNGVAKLDKVSSGAGAVGRVYFNASIPYKNSNP